MNFTERRSRQLSDARKDIRALKARLINLETACMQLQDMVVKLQSAHPEISGLVSVAGRRLALERQE